MEEKREEKREETVLMDEAITLGVPYLPPFGRLDSFAIFSF